MSPFGTVKTESENVWKSNRTKNTSKMLRYLLRLIYYSNAIFGNIGGKNKVISLYCALKCNGEFFLV